MALQFDRKRRDLPPTPSPLPRRHSHFLCSLVLEGRGGPHRNLKLAPYNLFFFLARTRSLSIQPGQTRFGIKKNMRHREKHRISSDAEIHLKLCGGDLHTTAAARYPSWRHEAPRPESRGLGKPRLESPEPIRAVEGRKVRRLPKGVENTLRVPQSVYNAPLSVPKYRQHSQSPGRLTLRPQPRSSLLRGGPSQQAKFAGELRLS